MYMALPRFDKILKQIQLNYFNRCMCGKGFYSHVNFNVYNCVEGNFITASYSTLCN